MKISSRCLERQEQIDQIVEKVGIEAITTKNNLVKERILNPSHYILLIGETSAGKSTIINSMLKEKIMVESVKPTTGIIAEVALSNEERSFARVNRNGIVEKISEEKFKELGVNPDDQLHRLRYTGAGKDPSYDGMHFFDTPGYGSLVDYHEDVLKNFIPEGDFIVYVVSYRVGLNEDDFQFLKYVGEVISEDVEVMLVVNMCPEGVDENNKRIEEIRQNVNKCIHRTIDTFCLKISTDKNPDTSELIHYIKNRINDPFKVKNLEKTLINYQNYVLSECSIKVNSKLASLESAQSSLEEKDQLTKEFEECKFDLETTINRGFARIKLHSTRLIDEAAIDIKERADRYIEDEGKWVKREETYAYIQEYYIPKLINEETEHVLKYIEEEIAGVDKDVKEALNRATKVFKDKVKINIPEYTTVLEGILKKHIGDAVKLAIGEMFRNVEDKKRKHQPADQKNFKRLEENTTMSESGIAKLIRTIRASSIKGITRYLGVFADGIIYLYDTINWQHKIKEMAESAIDNWATDVDTAIRKYVDEFKEDNKKEVMSLFTEISNEFNGEDEPLDEVNYTALVDLKKEIEKVG